jgi:8-hydroxy-5-deazaflavin:NADPH oxidoreductase
VKISVLGTGMVGRALAGRLAGVGHQVVVGTRDPATTLARIGTDAMGAPPYAGWQEEHPDVTLVSAAEAGAHAELLINATAGTASLTALDGAGVAHRDGLIVMDVANALEFPADGSAPALAVVGADSLGEQIQRRFPHLRVVKALNTMNCEVMADPTRVPGDHVVFVAGDDAEAKRTVGSLLRELGWVAGNVVDLGGLEAARGTEMFMPLWLSIMQAAGTADFNINIVRS